ncbi:hypothetical protein CBM2587_A40120 [Cupriavidus taiwanensis]|uniref:Uncharacterized protein n=1 Tax=Cupriavidus taiwanensis TaxID=164546 RepID=A0A975X2H3_9BURK|nr:hypothetical protein CBM2587_A40120 [Cupriavidus taiwanensis]
MAVQTRSALSELPNSSGLHLDVRSDSRTLLRATRPDPRTKRRRHINFPF